MPRNTLMICMLTVIMAWGLAQGSLARSPKALFGDPEIIMYLHDGTDVTGRITKVTDESLTVQTGKGDTVVPRKKYQGMVLNTSDQKKMADRITTDPEAMIAYGMYSQQTRETVTASLGKTMKSKCAAATLKQDIPLVHVQIDQQGKVSRTILLNASNCADVDAALLKDIKAIKLEPLPQNYPFATHSINYFYTKP